MKEIHQGTDKITVRDTLQDIEEFLTVCKRLDFLLKLKPSVYRDKLIERCQQHLDVEVAKPSTQNASSTCSDPVDFRQWSLFLESKFLSDQKVFMEVKAEFRDSHFSLLS
jgi:hypothetical protein